jgi:hypothetical protein
MNSDNERGAASNRERANRNLTASRVRNPPCARNWLDKSFSARGLPLVSGAETTTACVCGTSGHDPRKLVRPSRISLVMDQSGSIPTNRYEWYPSIDHWRKCGARVSARSDTARYGRSRRLNSPGQCLSRRAGGTKRARTTLYNDGSCFLAAPRTTA